MRRGHTTISCRAFALIALLIAFAGLPAAARGAKAGDRPPPPGLPLATWWSTELDGAVSAGPIGDGKRVYVALASAFLTARSAADGKEIWRHPRTVTSPMATAGDLLFVSSGDAIEALDGATGRTAWTLPRAKPVTPLVVQNEILIAITETEVIAIRASSGEVLWRYAGGGITLPPAIDGDRLYTGAADGRVVAMNVKDGSVAWDQFFPGGVTAIAAAHGRLYVGAGDKILYCRDAAKGARKWDRRIGAFIAPRIDVDDKRVYVAAFDNVVYALDRQSGNQSWQRALRARPYGVYVAGHVAFVPTVRSTELAMIYDYDGGLSGYLQMPGEILPDLMPAIADTAAGLVVYAVSGGLTNEWGLLKFALAGEAALIPFKSIDAMPGLPYLTDPELKPIGNLLGTLILGDPRLMPFSTMDWPIVLRDPPLVPLTTLPGLQLRPLSPKLPARSSKSGPGG